MPRKLHANSRITQAEANELDGLLTDYRTAHSAMETKETALTTLLTNADAGEEWETVDLFGDGRVKHREDCTVPSGRVPSGFKKRPGGNPDRERPTKVSREKSAAERRHRDAVVSARAMETADEAIVARRDAYTSRTNAAQALNLKIAELLHKGGVKRGFVVDVFGDGSVVHESRMTLPPEIKTKKHPAGGY